MNAACRTISGSTTTTGRLVTKVADAHSATTVVAVPGRRAADLTWVL
jgi:hypothetical protein